jgi:hypothetical protein
MPGEPRVTAPADPPAPERGAQPSAAEVQELAGFTNYKINTADRTIVALGIGKDRRAAELTAKRNLLHAVQTLPGHADATAGDLQGMQLDQEIKLADGGYGLIYLMPIPPAKE